MYSTCSFGTYAGHTAVQRAICSDMIYQVKATFNYDKAHEFHQKLTDGTIAKQRPDGAEISHSMKRAIIDDHGTVHWTEMCFCLPPLQHERSTVYDSYFTEMTTEPIPDYKVFEGKSFMEKLASYN